MGRDAALHSMMHPTGTTAISMMRKVWASKSDFAGTGWSLAADAVLQATASRAGRPIVTFAPLLL